MEDIGSKILNSKNESLKFIDDSIDKIDLLFVDADHSKEGCLNDMVNWWDNLVTGGHMVLHDCYFGCEVQDAVIEFIAGHDVEIVISPYKSHEHRRYPQGSFCHFIKK